MTHDEIVVHLVAGMLASKPFNRQAEVDQVSDIAAMHAIANKHAVAILEQRRRESEAEEQAEAEYYQSWRKAVLDWEKEADELLRLAGPLAIEVREGGASLSKRASVAATFLNLLHRVKP
jgi:hypothetical protein